MENKRDPVKSKALAIVEKQPGLALYQTAQLSRETSPPLPQYKSWEWENAQNEKPVKILSYMGSLPNQFGNDGDFYVDEMTNMLYGPKKGGVWPESGVLATGLCKRTWIAFTRMRVPSKLPERGLMARLKAFVRWLIPFKSIASNDRADAAR